MVTGTADGFLVAGAIVAIGGRVNARAGEILIPPIAGFKEVKNCRFLSCLGNSSS